jgi:PAS domain S-box-containing protein
MSDVSDSRMKGDLLKLFFSFLVPTVLLLLLLSAVYHRQDMEDIQRNREKDGSFTVQRQKEAIENRIRSIAVDLAVAANSHEFLMGSDPGKRKDWTAVASDFLQLARHRAIYDQVRLLDTTGRERVRVNFNGGNPAVVPEEELQFKGKRYYFLDAIGLERGSIFVSPFDLNVERGEIETPLKPMIRFATPVFDCGSNKIGLVILNYLGNDLLGLIERLAEGVTGDVMLLNADGYWLRGIEPADEWGFMYEDRGEITFPGRFPAAWEHIRSADSGQFTAASGFFTFATVYPMQEGMHSSEGTAASFVDAGTDPVDAGKYSWKVVSFLSASSLAAERRARLTRVALIDALLILIISVGTYLLAAETSRRKEADRALREAKASLDNIFDNSIPICVTGLNHEILLANRAYTDVFGDVRKAGATMKCHESRPGPACHSADCPMQQIVRGNEDVTCEPVKTDPDGSKEYFIVTARPFRDAAGNLTGIVESFQDITRRRNLEDERARLIDELKDALANVRQLSGFLPICASCKKIRDDRGYWNQIEAYIRDHSEAEFSHGICPECAARLYPGMNPEE